MTTNCNNYCKNCEIKDDCERYSDYEMELDENPLDFLSIHDNVNKPEHYTFGKIETIDYIHDKFTLEEFMGYCTGNVIKYISRWKHKGGIEDLKKASVYLNWAIEREGSASD